MFFKKLTIPESNTTTQVDAVQLWEVRWFGHQCTYHSLDYKTLDKYTPQVEVFTSEDEARKFKTALENAYRLVRATDAIKWITVSKAVSL